MIWRWNFLYRQHRLLWSTKLNSLEQSISTCYEKHYLLHRTTLPLYFSSIILFLNILYRRHDASHDWEPHGEADYLRVGKSYLGSEILVVERLVSALCSFLGRDDCHEHRNHTVLGSSEYEGPAQGGIRATEPDSIRLVSSAVWYLHSQQLLTFWSSSDWSSSVSFASSSSPSRSLWLSWCW